MVLHALKFAHRSRGVAWVWLVLALGFLGGAQAAAGPAVPKGMQWVRAVEGIAEYRLANGLQVLLVPDDSKPATTVNLTYRVGSRHEGYGETGMAHLLEHLIFKGSKRFAQPWAEFNKRGLAANGTTSFDRTNYFASFSRNDDTLRWYLAWQADAMVASFIARKDLDTEMTVVRNEMESGENDAGRMLVQRTMALMFDWHNYGKSTIGARSDVENVDIARLQAFYRLYYQPDNATLIVSGQFDAQRTLRWIAESFGPIARPKRALPPQYTLEAVQDGERSFTQRRSGGAPLVLAGYHMPPAAHPDHAAAEMLAYILADEPAGRLHRRLVQTKLAAGVWGFAWDLAEPGVAMFGAQLGPGQDTEAAERELLAAVESFAKEPVSEEELSRARAKWLKSWHRQFSDAQKVGVALSDAVAQGDWRLYFLTRDRVRDITVADVQRVSTQRLLASNRTVARHVPTPQAQRAPAPARVDVARQMNSFRPSAALAQVQAFEATPAQIEARTQRFEISDGKRGALKVALLPKPTRGEVVQARLELRFGEDKSLAGEAATGELLAAMLGKGSQGRSRQQIQDRLDELLTELSISGGADRLAVAITGRRATFAEAMALVGELLRQPAFEPAVLDEVRRQALAAVESGRQEPETVASNALARQGDPYPRGDPRHARSFDEIAADLQAVSVERLRSFHQRFVGASNAQFSAVGDFDAPAVRQALTRALGGWPSAAPYARITEPWTSLPATRLVLPTPDKANAVLMLRQPLALGDNDADYAAFSMANWLLGGSNGDSRLWTRVREKEGLSYGIQSWVEWNSFEPHSPWNVWGIFAPANRDKVESAVREEIERALRDGFTADELKAGQRGLLAFRRLGRAQDERLAAVLAANLELDRTLAVAQRVDDEIARLTPRQVHDALRRHLQPQAFVTAVAGDFKEP
jgi:zinc protease